VKGRKKLHYPVRAGLWHNHGVSEGGSEEEGGRRRARRVPRPLSPEALNELAVHYVARFATSRAKLGQYLQRKVRERGWKGEEQPDLDGLVQRLVGLGFIDDQAFAEAKAGSLMRRGYGGRRVHAALAQAGIEEADREGATRTVEAEAFTAALRFAERRRIGPWAKAAMEREERSKALAAMLRAGHGFDLARRIVEAAPGDVPEQE
jgi:regulatory protein